MKDYKKHIVELFNEGRKNGGEEFIYTLVRVSGMGERDELLSLMTRLESNTDIDDLLHLGKLIVNSEEVFKLIYNLLNSANGEHYNGFPFNHLYSGDVMKRERASPIMIVKELESTAKKFGKSKFAGVINRVFPNDILNYLYSKDGSASEPPDLVRRIKECCYFVEYLLDIYFEERQKYKEMRKLYKCLGFEVFELLTNEEFGLYGFKRYFSNGTVAYFTREPDTTDCVNISSFGPVNFFIGNIGELKNEWMIKDKRLYEVGLPGRYNKLGDWKPIIHPGKVEHLINEAMSMSDDGDLQGAYFYMLCTGHRIVEFVVRTTIVLPSEFTNFGNTFHLWKCPSDNKTCSNDGIQIYDGWIDLETGDIEEIEMAIRSIGFALNIIGFTYNVPIDWRIKYKMVERADSIAHPTKEDMEILDRLLKKMDYEGKDSMVLSYAIDWYVRGRSSRNIFMRFLNYFISLESIAIAVAEGNASFGLDIEVESKRARKQYKIECIKQKYDSLYEKDPIQFVEVSYYDCVKSIKSRIHKVTALVFGSDSEYLNLLFVKTNDCDPSLYDIRGKLAHGDVALFNNEDERLVRVHLHEIENICKEFLLRIILKLNPSDDIPDWSETHTAKMYTIDPRTTLWSNTEEVFPKSASWKIRNEWI